MPHASRTKPPDFAFVSGRQVQQILDGQELRIVALIEATYLRHHKAGTVNPSSSFITFPDRPGNRIIALPAALLANDDGRGGVDGIKWIASVPGNIEHGLPRASAVILLNNQQTGFPFACLEGSVISSARTAASAVLAADRLTRHRGRPTRLGVIGTGLIARTVLRYLARTGWQFTDIALHDQNLARAENLADDVPTIFGTAAPARVALHSRPEDLLVGSDLVLFATVGGAPYLDDPALLDHHPVVLHLSLRDLHPSMILGAINVVDDVEHCLTAGTSVHLAEQLVGDRRFLAGTLADVLDGRISLDPDATIVFSPFGLGVLDLAVAEHVYRQLRNDDALLSIPDFFNSETPHGGGS